MAEPLGTVVFTTAEVMAHDPVFSRVISYIL